MKKRQIISILLSVFLCISLFPTTTLAGEGDVLVTSITVSAPYANNSMYVGNSVQLAAEVLPLTATNPNVNWSIASGNDYVTLSSDGLLTLVAPGTSILRATAQDGSTVYGELIVNIAYWDGEGTVESPYLISNKTQLDKVRTNLSAHYKLTEDITFTNEDFAAGGAFYNDGAGFAPIGLGITFTGVFDGNNHTITGLYQKISVTGTTFAGLFAYVNGGAVKNLGVIDANITVWSFGSLSGVISGIIAGYLCADGTITDCYTTGQINGSSDIGGIVGYVDNATIKRCYNMASVSGSNFPDNVSDSNQAGGIAGFIYESSVTDCYNIGKISDATYTGGIVGDLNKQGDVKKCYGMGTMSNSRYPGALLGVATYPSSIKDCFYSDRIEKPVGYGSFSFPQLTPEQMEDETNFPAFDFDTVWTMEGNEEYPYPELRGLEQVLPTDTSTFVSGRGTSYSPYHIATKEQLNAVRDNLDACFVLDNDIVFAETDFEEGGDFYNGGKAFSPIGSAATPFTGVFDGNDHIISGVYQKIVPSDEVNYAGLFGYANSCTIKRLGIEDISIDAEFSGNHYLGAVVGYIDGKSNIISCYNTSNLKASYYVGGIVGQTSGSSTIKDCYNTGNITSHSSVGGITGYFNGSSTIKGCYNTGNLNTSFYSGGITGHASSTSSLIEDCYNTGNLIGGQESGGIVGRVDDTSVTRCYNIGIVRNTNDAGGIVGKIYNNCPINDSYYFDISEKGVGLGSDNATKLTQEQMADKAYFIGFDFEANWTIDKNEAFPFPELRAIDMILPEENDVFASGRGTPYSPYHIQTKAQLNAVRDYLDACFVLDNDIVFTASDFEEGGDFYNAGTGFAPIGSSKDSPFTGTFEGNAHSITALFQCFEFNGSTAVVVGLFGYVDNCVINNLSMKNGNLTAKPSATVSVSSAYAGSIAAYATRSTIMGCSNTGLVAVEKAYGNFFVGGIVGYLYSCSTISDCYNTGMVRSSNEHGGIAAHVNARSTIKNSYNTGFVTNNSNGGYRAGGIAAHVEGYSNILDCYNVGEVACDTMGGIAADIETSTIKDCYYIDTITERLKTDENNFALEYVPLSQEQMMLQESFTTFDFDKVWTMSGNGDYLLPELIHTPMLFVKETDSVDVTTLPTKLSYFETENVLNMAGGKITVHYNNGTSEVIDITADMVSGFDNTVIGEQTLTVTYGSKTATFDIEIIAKLLTSITVTTQPTKLVYIEGKDTLDITGGRVTLNYNNNTKEVIDLTADMVSGFDNAVIGEQALTVTYSGKTATFMVEILAKAVSSIAMETLPTKLTYLEGKDTLDVTGGKVKVYYNDNTSNVIDITADMVSGFDNTLPAQQELTVTYADKTATFDIEIIAKTLSSIAMNNLPTKLTFFEGIDALDVTGGTIKLFYNNGTEALRLITPDMVSGFDNLALGNQTLTVRYSTETTTFDIKVIAKSISSISVNNLPTKLTYLEGTDTLDVTGGIIMLYYNDNTADFIDITPEMVSGFDNMVVGEQLLTVTYKDCTTTYEIWITALPLPDETIDTPTSVKATGGYGSVKLTWTKVSDASGYYLYRYTGLEWAIAESITTEPMSENLSENTSKNTLTYKITNLKAGVKYCYKLYAYKDGESSYACSYESATVFATPKLATPKLKTTKASSSSVKLTWTKPVGYANGYVIYRNTRKRGTYKVIKTIKKKNKLNWTNTKLTKLASGKIYYYKIRAYRTVSGKKIYSRYSSAKKCKKV